MSQGPAAALMAAYTALLKREGVDYEVGDDGLLMLSGDAECGRCPGYLSVDDLAVGEGDAAVDAVLVQAAFVLPPEGFDPVPTEDKPAVYEFIAYAAPDLGMGGFELDPDDGRLRFRVSMVWPAGPIAPAIMLTPLVESLAAIDDYAAHFTRVLAGEAEPAHIYVEAVLNDLAADAIRPSEGDRVRLLSMLEVATARYRARDDQVRLDALVKHIRDLSAA